jgi:hypothetical protein
MTQEPTEYQLIGLTEDGSVGDLLSGLDQKQGRVRLQALISECWSPAPARLHAVPDSTCRISVLASLGACKDLWAGSRFFVGRR